jgi:hypothetical protein
MKTERALRSCNRRGRPRYALPLRLSTDDSGEEYLYNISLGGCCFSTSRQYQAGDHVLLHFESPLETNDNDRSFCLDGCVLWVRRVDDDCYTYGMVFPPVSGDFLQSEMTVFYKTFTQLADRSPLV